MPNLNSAFQSTSSMRRATILEYVPDEDETISTHVLHAEDDECVWMRATAKN